MPQRLSATCKNPVDVFLSMKIPQKAALLFLRVMKQYIEVLRYSFSETIPKFFNRPKSNYILVRTPQNFRQSFDYELKFAKMQFLVKSISL